MELDLAEVSVPDILRSGMSMHGERASRAGVALGLTVEPEQITIEADERRVRQVVFNLLSNAMKFTPRTGASTCRRASLDGIVEVAVADTGAGIPPGDLEPDLRGVRAGRQRRRRAARTGPGSGCRCPASSSSCTAAACGSRAGPAPAARSGSHCPSSRRRNAMADEADPDRRRQRAEPKARAGRAALRRLSHAGGGGGVEGVALAVAHRPDLVLMDIRMADMNGTEALRKLREDERTVEIPVVALTSLTMKGDREGFLAAGFDGYLRSRSACGSSPTRCEATSRWRRERRTRLPSGSSPSTTSRRTRVCSRRS